MIPRTSALALAAALLAAAAPAAMPRLEVSGNGRYLVEQDGAPFFYLADTAWELFHRLDREEATLYLEHRAAQGFTVIQAVALAELGGLDVPNAYGHLPLVDNDPTRPAVVDGPDNDYWDHVDFIVAKANALGLRVGFLPTWGDKWHKASGGRVIFTPGNAEAYGAWIGERYRDAGVIWILGGDRTVDDDQERDILRAMARGLARGDEGRHLMTFHPRGYHGSAEAFHNDDWLDFNMVQTGHNAQGTNYGMVERDYALDPPKPLLDGEPAYEYPPHAMPPDRPGSHVGALQVRRNAYWALFAGACGHAHGTHPVWQMFDEGREPRWNVTTPWRQALDNPGASQLIHAKRLLLSRPFLTRIPDQAALLDGPTEKLDRVQVTRDVTPGANDATYMMAYFPGPAPASLRTGVMAGETLRVWWFDPRTGEASLPLEMPREDATTFTPPEGEGPDWVLVVDDAARDYPPPGQPWK